MTGPLAQTGLAFSYYKQGKHADAIALYEAIIKDNPQHWEAILNIGVCYLET